VKLIVGLGNPGIEYQFTPHNLGFLAVDRIAGDRDVEVRNRQCHALTARVVIGSETVLLAKPETFMNLSGLAVRDLVARHEVTPEKDLIVIYDEMDLPLGTLRIRQRGRSAGHNGMKSIIGALGTQEFLRIRLGIAPEQKILKPSGTGCRRRSGWSDSDRRPGGGHEPLQSQAERRRRRRRRKRLATDWHGWSENLVREPRGDWRGNDESHV
jgi:aminoacyl-tRNA hydrolase